MPRLKAIATSNLGNASRTGEGPREKKREGEGLVANFRVLVLAEKREPPSSVAVKERKKCYVPQPEKGRAATITSHISIGQREALSEKGRRGPLWGACRRGPKKTKNKGKGERRCGCSRKTTTPKGTPACLLKKKGEEKNKGKDGGEKGQRHRTLGTSYSRPDKGKS